MFIFSKFFLEKNVDTFEKWNHFSILWIVLKIKDFATVRGGLPPPDPQLAARDSFSVAGASPPRKNSGDATASWITNYFSLRGWLLNIWWRSLHIDCTSIWILKYSLFICRRTTGLISSTVDTYPQSSSEYQRNIDESLLCAK